MITKKEIEEKADYLEASTSWCHNMSFCHGAEWAMKKMRLVSDQSFATRLLSFVKDVKVNDHMSCEEKEYIEKVAKDLLKYQIETATEQSEIDYLERIKQISNKKHNEDNQNS